VGGLHDNSSTGAAWVYTRSGGVWTQQGSKLVGARAVGQAGQGFSVALSANGNAVIVGRFGDNSYIGVAWVFGRNGTVWTQQGNKLVGTGAVERATQGVSVALSAARRRTPTTSW
jgi:antibiotic biosynthesis monooxygenase (ABM) superfamily enzyme